MTTNIYKDNLLKNLESYFNIIQKDKYFDDFRDINNYNINYEIEFVYSNNENIINLDTFKQIIKLLKCENIPTETTQELNVSTYHNYPSLSNIRVIIDTQNNIKTFCNDEKHYLINNPNKKYQQKNDMTQQIKKILLDNFKLNLKLEKDLNEESIEMNRFNNYYDIEEIKTYRYKNRLRFKYDYFYIDITSVKTLENYDMKTKSFKDTSYEFELEINTKKLFMNFYDDNGNFNYQHTDYKNFIDNLYTKLCIINNIISKNLYDLNNNLKKDIKNEYKILTNSKFLKILGPKPISLTYKDLKHIYETDEFHTKTIYPYKFTDKADGERYNLFINKEGYIYLINNQNILNVNRKINNKDYFNSIIDGEFITIYPNNTLDIFDDYLSIKDFKSDIKKYVFSFNAFDIYIINEKKLYLNYENDQQQSNFSPKKLNYSDSQNGRLDLLENIVKTINEIDINDNITFNVKTYDNISKLKHFNDKDTKNKYINDKPYNLDGLILIPNIEIPNNNIKNIWRSNLKWKPKILNTIDFKIKITSNKEYHLYSYITDKYKHNEIHFQSVQPYIKDIHIVQNPTKTIIHNENVLNNQIVECIYHNSEWKFLRIRHDKTNPNPLDVANKTFFNIFNTFKFEYIENIETIAEQYNYYINNNYYDNDDNINNNKHTNDFSFSYRKYNNNIKKYLIEYNLPLSDNLNILDIGCGRGGDIIKFMNTINKKQEIDLNFYLGIDKDNNNITGENNARERFINLTFKTEYKKFNNKFNFITGDINEINHQKTDTKKMLKDLIIQPINNQPLFIQEIIRNDAEYDTKIIDDNFISEPKFDFINCQFMIHYIDDLREFFKSIYNLLNDDGIFIATYIDSNELKKLMMVKEITDKELQEIRKIPKFKNIENTDIYKDNFQTIINYENKLHVKLNSTDNFYEENLVNTKKLIDNIDENLEVITNNNFNSIKQDNSIYKTSIKELGDVNKFLILKKRNITIGGKTELEFINFVLNL